VSARRAFFAGMNAIGDAIAAHCPPEHEVSFAWPDTHPFDQGLLGGARLGWPPDCAENECRAWLVLGIMLRAADLAHLETGAIPGAVSLTGVGFEMVETDAIVASLRPAPHGRLRPLERTRFGPIAFKLPRALLRHEAGERRGIDRNGDLLVSAPLDKRPTVRIGLVEALARAAWYDPSLRGPRLSYESDMINTARAPSGSMPQIRSCSSAAAEPGEWAVSGSFLFCGCDEPAALGQKTARRPAFRLSGDRQSRLVDTCHCDRGDGSGQGKMPSSVSRRTPGALRRTRSSGARPCGGRRDRLCDVPLRSPAPDVARCPAQHRGWRNPRAVSHAEAAGFSAGCRWLHRHAPRFYLP